MTINSLIVVSSTILNKVFGEDQELFAERVETIDVGTIRFDLTLLDEEGYFFLDDATVEDLQSKLNGVMGRWANFQIIKEKPRGEDYLVPTGIMMCCNVK